MDGESITPLDGNAPLSLDDAAGAISALFNRKPEAATPDEDEADREPEAEDEFQPASDDEVEDVDPEAEPDAETEEPEDDAEVTFTLPDGTVTNPAEVDEWRKGYLRQSDYTRKTQELAEARKATETAKAEVAEKASLFSQQIDLAIQLAEAYLPPAPDLALMNTDPIGYIQAKEAREFELARVNQLLAAKQQHEAEVVRQKTAEFQEWAKGEQVKLLEVLPELKNPAKTQELISDLKTYLPKLGYSEADIGQMHDHRLVRVAKYAIAYLKLQENRPKAVDKAKTAAPVQPTGRRGVPTNPQAAGKRQALDTLRKSGRVEDAANAILALSKGR